MTYWTLRWRSYLLFNLAYISTSVKSLSVARCCCSWGLYYAFLTFLCKKQVGCILSCWGKTKNWQEQTEFLTNLGASSTTFWFLLWMEHSLSFSHRALPCLSASTYKNHTVLYYTIYIVYILHCVLLTYIHMCYTCISMCLGLSMYFSISSLSSPKLDAASWDEKRKPSL